MDTETDAGTDERRERVLSKQGTAVTFCEQSLKDMLSRVYCRPDGCAERLRTVLVSFPYQFEFLKAATLEFIATEHPQCKPDGVYKFSDFVTVRLGDGSLKDVGPLPMCMFHDDRRGLGGKRRRMDSVVDDSSGDDDD